MYGYFGRCLCLSLRVAVFASCLPGIVGSVEIADARFTVMSYNVGDRGPSRPSSEQILAILNTTELADILLVQDRPWHVRLDDMAGSLSYPFFVSGRDRPHVTHLGILSKYPLTDVESIGFGAPGARRGAICANAGISGKTIRVCNVHLPSLSRVVSEGEKSGSFGETFRALFSEVFSETERSRAISDLLIWLKKYQDHDMVIAGDFNTFNMSLAIRRLQSDYDDACRSFNEYSQGTYIGLKIPFRPRIDYIFHSKGLNPVRCDVREHTAGDHFPVFAEFDLPSHH